MIKVTIGQNMNRDGYHMNFEYGRSTNPLPLCAASWSPTA